MKKTTIILMILTVNILSGQLKVHTITEAEKLNRILEKPIIIYLYTDWCQYCKAMELRTFKKAEVSDLLNKYFYFVKINAEERNTISFEGEEFQFLSTGIDTGYNEIIKKFLPTQDSNVFPWIIIYDKRKIAYQKKGFQSAKEFQIVLSKIQENIRQ